MIADLVVVLTFVNLALTAFNIKFMTEIWKVRELTRPNRDFILKNKSQD